MQPLLRVFLGAITATLVVSSIAFAMGPPIIDQTSADVVPPATQADPTLEAVGSTTQTSHKPGTRSQEPFTSDEAAAAGPDTTKQRASDAKASGESPTPTTTSTPFGFTPL